MPLIMWHCWRQRVTMKHATMNLCSLWNNIEARLDSRRPDWRTYIDEMCQLAAVKNRSAGKTWSDDKVFKALLMAVLSSGTDWSKIKRIQGKLAKPFSDFSLEAYTKVSETKISDRLVPWFEKERAGSPWLRNNLGNLVRASRKLLDHSRTHGTADSYFTSLMHRCDEDPKQAALCLGSPGKYKLPSLGPALAAEALKNLGFDVAKPDRHIMRAVGSFGLVPFEHWRDRRRYTSPKTSSKRVLLKVMSVVEEIASAAKQRVTLVDNAIWLLCERGGRENGLYLTNEQLAKMACSNE